MNKKEIAELEDYIKNYIHTFESYEGMKPTLKNGLPTIACDYNGAVSMYDAEGIRVIYTVHDNSAADRFATMHKTFLQIKEWLEVPAEERNTVSVTIESKGKQVAIKTKNHLCIFDVSQSVYEMQASNKVSLFMQANSVDQLESDDLKALVWYCLNECKGEWI